MAGHSPAVHHPLFARVYDRISRSAEETEEFEHRRELLAGLSGRVIEVGAGNGLNFKHYPETVTEVVAVEPERYLRERAAEAAAEARVPVRIVDGLAEELPAETASLDAGVVSLVLCSVADQAVALAELARVLRPGGELRFYEHVASETPGIARLQRALDFVWPRIAGGCHTSRTTAEAIERAGFEVESRRRLSVRPCVLVAPVAPHVLGVARRPQV